MDAIAFFVLASLTIVSAIVVITHRNPVTAAVALAFNLVAIAGMFLVLDAQFIGLLQVIVYAGAIMVLILFVIMLLNLREEERGHPAGRIQRVLAPLTAILLGAVIGRAVWSSSPSAFPAKADGFGTASVLGKELFTRFFYPFEAVSLLLVVAMIAAVLLAKRKLS